MKHIKLFESFKELYDSITVYEFNEIHDHENQYFTNREIEFVKNNVEPSNRNIYRSDIISLKYGSLQMSTRKFKDEWYTLHICKITDVDSDDYIFKYYKCDQMDGLIKCIKDNYETYKTI